MEEGEGEGVVGREGDRNSIGGGEILNSSCNGLLTCNVVPQE